jgi:hypothetical protein
VGKPGHRCKEDRKIYCASTGKRDPAKATS